MSLLLLFGAQGVAVPHTPRVTLTPDSPARTIIVEAARDVTLGSSSRTISVDDL